MSRSPSAPRDISKRQNADKNGSDDCEADQKSKSSIFRYLFFITKARVVFLVGLAIAAGIYIFPRTDPLMVITAETRGLSYKVVNIENSRILFRGEAAIVDGFEGEKKCLSGLLEPVVSAEVTYSLFDKLLHIGITADDNVVARFRAFEPNGEVIPIENGGSVSYGFGSECDLPKKGYPPVRLPIWGPATLGRNPHPATMAGRADPFSGLLIRGDVSVFGRKTFNSGIYPAGVFDLPAGAQLSGFADVGNHAPWWGYASYVSLADDQELAVMVLSASTTTEKLNIKRQAGPGSENIEVGFFNRLSGEPIFAIVLAFLAALLFWSEFVQSFRNLWGIDFEE